MNQQHSAYELLKQSHPINAQVLVQAAICRSLPANGLVAVENLSQSILASLVKQAGLNSITVIGTSILRKYGAKLWLALEGNAGPVECIGSKNAELLIQPKVQAGFANIAQDVLNIHLKSIDNAFLGRSNVCWLAFDKGNVEILASGEKTVNEYRPLISFSSFDDVQLARKWCTAHNYVLLNADLEEPISAVPQGLYLFPDADFVQTLRNKLCPSFELNMSSVIQSAQIKHLWPEICGLSDKLAGQTCAYLQSNERIYDLQEMIGFNIYDTEWHDNTEWRWTGPGHDSIILLPMRAKGLFSVELSVLALPEGISNSVVRCFMNGKLHFEGDISAGCNISFSYYADNPHEPVELLLSTEKTANIAGRQLGVAISAIKVRWETHNA